MLPYKSNQANSFDWFFLPYVQNLCIEQAGSTHLANCNRGIELLIESKKVVLAIGCICHNTRKSTL